MKNDLFQVEHRPVIKYGGKEFETVCAAKLDALMTYPGMTPGTAQALVSDADKVSSILLWEPAGQPAKPKGSPEVTDEQIASACKDTGIPYKIAKNRIRQQGWTLGKATTTPVRKRTLSPVSVEVTKSSQ